MDTKDFICLIITVVLYLIAGFQKPGPRRKFWWKVLGCWFFGAILVSMLVSSFETPEEAARNRRIGHEQYLEDRHALDQELYGTPEADRKAAAREAGE
jgi:hypothetical protein